MGVTVIVVDTPMTVRVWGSSGGVPFEGLSGGDIPEDPGGAPGHAGLAAPGAGRGGWIPNIVPIRVAAAFAHEPASGATADAGVAGSAMANSVGKEMADIATKTVINARRPRWRLEGPSVTSELSSRTPSRVNRLPKLNQFAAPGPRPDLETMFLRPPREANRPVDDFCFARPAPESRELRVGVERGFQTDGALRSLGQRDYMRICNGILCRPIGSDEIPSDLRPPLVRLAIRRA